MKAEIVQNLKERYLVLEEESPYREDYRYYMLLSNHIRGVLPCSLRCMDTSLRFYYSIEDMDTFQKYMEQNGLTRELWMSFLTAVWELEEECRAYLLQIENILLRPEYVYYKDGIFWFCYLPIHEEQPEIALHRMAGELQKFCDSGDTDTTEFLKRMEEKTGEEHCLLRDVIRQLREEGLTAENEGPDRIDTENFAEDMLPFDNAFFQDGKLRFRSIEEQLFAEDDEEKIPDLFHSGSRARGFFFSKERREERQLLKEKKLDEKYRKREQKRAAKEALRQEKQAARLMRKEEKLREQEEHLRLLKDELADRRLEEELLEMEEDPATTYLFSEERPHKLTLTDKDGRDRMIIDESPYYIGSDDSGYVQGYIPNPVISKRHAQILSLSGFYFLEDLGSLNGTLHNGHRLDTGERVRINVGDVVHFANLEYRVFATRADRK